MLGAMKLKTLSFLLLLALAGSARADGVVEIANPAAYREILALSDVHGMAQPLLHLLTGAKVIDRNGNWAAGNTLLVVVGDSIDKGPDSLDVLDLWMRLTTQAAAVSGRVVVLLGNHEAEFLADPENDKKAAALYDELQRKHVELRELTDRKFPRARFLRSLPVAARIGKWFFCHAGLFPKLSWKNFTAQATALLKAGDYQNDFFSADDSLLEAKDWWSDDEMRSELEARLEAQGMTGVVFGHQPGALGAKGKLASTDGGRIIKIDNGMAPEAGAHKGHLLQFPNSDGSGAMQKFFSIGESGVPQSVSDVVRPKL